MSIVIALLVILAVGILISKYYPKPNKTIVVAPEPPEIELAPETSVVIEPLVETKVETPKMDAKPKKKPHHKKKPAKKPNA